LHQSLTRELPYEPRQLFDLVGDVERYPEFVPWVRRLTTRGRRVAGDGAATLEAEAEVGFSIIHERFATTVKLDVEHLCIDVGLISGPFRSLTNSWRFVPYGLGTELRFEIDFEFRSRLLTALFAANAHRAITSLVGCFEARARGLYGPKPSLAPPA
jgi:coenzyme Q-binding protein COQ10